MTNKESVTKGGRAVAILKQRTMRERWDVKGIKRERQIEGEREKYQRRDAWTQCQVMAV